MAQGIHINYGQGQEYALRQAFEEAKAENVRFFDDFNAANADLTTIDQWALLTKRGFNVQPSRIGTMECTG